MAKLRRDDPEPAARAAVLQTKFCHEHSTRERLRRLAESTACSHKVAREPQWKHRPPQRTKKAQHGVAKCFDTEAADNTDALWSPAVHSNTTTSHSTRARAVFSTRLHNKLLAETASDDRRGRKMQVGRVRQTHGMLLR